MEVLPIIHAIQDGPKYSELDQDKRLSGLLGIIARLYSLKNMGDKAGSVQKDKKIYPSDEVKLALGELSKDIAIKYPYMTLSEIRFALESGVKGDLDEQPTILSVANYCRWLRLYNNSAARLEAVQAIMNNKSRLEPSNQLNVGTTDERNEEAISRLEKQLRKEVKDSQTISTNHSDLICEILYNWLRKTNRMEKPNQAYIDSIRDEILNNHHEKKITKKKLILMIKRKLLEEYLSLHSS